MSASIPADGPRYPKRVKRNVARSRGIPQPRQLRSYLSLGAGVQSTALYVCATLGLHGVERPDVAIFADTGDEPRYVYDYLDTIEAWGKERNGPRIDRVSKGHLSADVLDQTTNRSGLPLFTEGQDGRASMLLRKCTSEYKITPIERHVRQLLGVDKGDRLPKGTMVRALIGISLDEVQRMKPSRTWWCENTYPLIDARLRRGDCERLVVEAGLPMPRKSACVFCPFHGDAEWLHMRDNEPAEFARAVEFDRQIRDMSKSGVRGRVFLHRSLKPLDQATFRHDGQLGLTWNGECEGMCGV